MTPEMRARLKAEKKNSMRISMLIESDHPDAIALIDVGLTAPELGQLQRCFDSYSDHDVFDELTSLINQMPD